MIAFGGRAFGRRVGHESRALINEIRAVMKAARQSPTCKDAMRSLKPRSGPSRDHAGTLILDLQPPEA